MYENKRREHIQSFGIVNLDKIKQPQVPVFLAMYFELQRWPGSLLWDGGLLDQPAWVWEMIDLAGLVYLSGEKSKANLQDLMRGE